jgi:hypothetical protein
MRDVTLAKKGKGKELGESNITKLQHLQDDEVIYSLFRLHTHHDLTTCY